jgi:hypothetical protein
MEDFMAVESLGVYSILNPFQARKSILTRKIFKNVHNFHLRFVVSHTSGAEVQFVPPKKIVPQKRAVSVAMDGPILSRILCTLMPISVVL